MKIVNEKTLARFRAGPCLWCRRPGPTEPHHLWAKGMGGGGRLDVPINLAALCSFCHRAHHDGHHPMSIDLFVMVADREGVLHAYLERQILRMRKADKWCKVCDMCDGRGKDCLPCDGMGIFDFAGEPWREST